MSATRPKTRDELLQELEELNQSIKWMEKTMQYGITCTPLHGEELERRKKEQAQIMAMIEEMDKSVEQKSQSMRP